MTIHESDNNTLSFTLSDDAYVELNILDITGEKIAQVMNSALEKGKYEFNFNLHSQNHSAYSYKLSVYDKIKNRFCYFTIYKPIYPSFLA